MLSGKVRVRSEIVKVEGPSMASSGSMDIRMPRPDKVLLVLQVEVSGYVIGHITKEATWRDATVEDLSFGSIGKINMSLKSC